MKIINTLILLSVFVFASCSSEPRLDGSNMDAFKSSKQAIEATLAGQDLQRFTMAMVIVSGHTQVNNADDPSTALLALLDGKSQRDVSVLAKELASTRLPDH